MKKERKPAYLLMNFKSALLHFSCQITQAWKKDLFFGLLTSANNVESREAHKK